MERNRAARTELRTVVKSARLAIASGDKEAAAKSTLRAEQALASAAGKGIIKRNTASRTTSRLVKAAAKLA